MEKTFIATAIVLLAGALSGYSQGQIAFYNYGGGGTLHAAIYPAQGAVATTYMASYGSYTAFEEVGQGTAPIEKPSGTKTYLGTGLQGTAWDAQLLAGPAGITSLSGTVGGVGLIPVGTIMHFHTQAATAGMINGTQPVVLPTESCFSGGDQISVAIAAWSSAYLSLAAAQEHVFVDWGISPVEQTTAAGGLTVSPSAPINMPTTIESFSLGFTDYIPPMPEPSTIALGVLGAAGLLFRRRR
jgi:hypothetical protein